MTTAQNPFKKAERSQAKIKIALSGPSGSGKTFSALKIATGLGEKIALLDTENRSASLYGDLFSFDTVAISAPFLSEKYIQGIKAAVANGYDVLVIDSITHQWAGEGGILDRKDKEQLAKPGTNGYMLWAKYTPEHLRFIEAINQSNIHIISTIRSKQDYVIEQNEKGKLTPRKVGLAPVQREGTEFEYTLVLDISMEHYAVASKDRTHLFKDAFIPTEETGKMIRDWVSSGVKIKPENMEEKPKINNPLKVVAPTQTQIEAMLSAFFTYGVSKTEIETFIGKPVTEFVSADLKNLSEIYGLVKSGTRKMSEFFVNLQVNEDVPGEFENFKQ